MKSFCLLDLLAKTKGSYFIQNIESEIPLPADQLAYLEKSLFLSNLDPDFKINGIILLPDELILITSHPIIRSYAVDIIYLILALLPTSLTQDLPILALMVIITLISIQRGVINDRKNN